ncbi:hypothetical protein SAMN04487944_1249 [Gracilibacillus ureilyticus]|uniref:Uncharacterized protein n=1 Tax=Gracilibacillus ureilyticus TaxID=531814 RepID=A0A1H9VIS9_9BACI|nr:hypothetical protein [Gracilibacillus ureilyticus]SES21444.1 hypothetical protein SAMN04487944_1249 [Gracilibacillus ureilyticus]
MLHRKKLLYILLIFFLLAACQEEEPSDESIGESTNQNSVNEKKVSTISDSENANLVDEEDNDLKEEDVDPLADLLERAPEEPATLDEIIAYPVGPLAGNGERTGTDPILEIEEKAAFVKEVLPPIEEEEEEEYIDQWWRAFRYIFSEEYPDPRQILEKINFTHFGNAKLEDEMLGSEFSI